MDLEKVDLAVDIPYEDLLAFDESHRGLGTRERRMCQCGEVAFLRWSLDRRCGGGLGDLRQRRRNATGLTHEPGSLTPSRPDDRSTST